MSYNLILNSSNVVGANNNQFKYNFIGGSFTVPEGAEISISQITIPYSWFNVSSALGNNTFSYLIPVNTIVGTASSSAGVLTVATVTSGTISVGSVLSVGTGTSIRNFIVQSFGTGTGTTGTYNVDNISTVSVTTMNGTPPPVTVTLNDGFYGISDLNNALNTSLRQNNYYFYNQTSPVVSGVSDIPSSQIIYPIQFGSNASNYTNTITFQYIPTSTGNVTTQFGTNWVWANSFFPIHATLPTITIPQQSGVNVSSSTFGIGNILGFTTGIYPQSYAYGIGTGYVYYGLNTSLGSLVDTPSITNSNPLTINGNSLKTYTYNGFTTAGGNNTLTVTGANPTFAPLGTSVNGVVVRCNLIENNVTMPSDVLDSFPITSTFGSNINYLPITDNAVRLKQGKFSNLIISFSDQNFNPLLANDPNVLISLLIHFPSDKK